VIKVRVEAEVRPTEEVEKVKKAITNIIDVDDFNIIELGGGLKLLIGESNSIRSLLKLHHILRVERILDTTRSVMFKSLINNTLTLKIHKQSAFIGKLSLITHDDESPLGPITITITSDKIREVIDWLAPKTSKGRPLWERDMPDV